MDSSKLLIQRMNELPEQLDGLNTSITTNVSQLNERINNTALNLNEKIDTTSNDLNALITALTQRIATLEARKYVTEWVTSGTSWYRRWSDGFFEQGWQTAISSSGQTVTMYKPMGNTNYTVVANGLASARYVSCWNKTTTTFSCYTGDDSSFNSATANFYVCGKGT